MKFFLDCCISSKLSKALQIVAQSQGCEIVHLTEKFPKDVKDVDWIVSLAKEGGWIIVSGDPRITKGRAEKKAWGESGLPAFFFGGGFADKNIWIQAKEMFSWWPVIMQHCKGDIKPCGYIMPFKGSSLKQIFTEE
jgi:hypothetical protein